MNKKDKPKLKYMVINDAIWNFIAASIVRVGGLIFTILAARILMPEGFGIYILAFSVASIFMTFIDCGINQTLIRFASSEIDKNQKKAAAYFRYLFKAKIILSIIASLILIVSSFFLSFYIFKKSELLLPLILFGVYNLIFSVESFFEALFYIKNRVKYIALKEIIYQPIRVLALLAIIYFLTKKYYVIGAVIGSVVALFLELLVILYFYKKNFSFMLEKHDIKIEKKRVLKFAGHLIITNLLALLFSYVDIVVLGIFLSAAYIGYYKAAMGLIMAITGALSFPGIFSSTLVRVKRKNLQNSFDKILRYFSIIIIPSIAGIYLLAPYIIVFIYGYEYLKASTLLYILTPLIFFIAMGGLLYALLSSKEKTKELAVLTMLITFLNIVLVYLSAKLLVNYSEISAAAGVAIATLFSWMIYFGMCMFIIKKKLNISFKYSYLIKPIIASLIMSCILYFVGKMIHDNNLILGLLEVILGVAIYFLSLFIIGGLIKEDIKDIIKSLGL